MPRYAPPLVNAAGERLGRVVAYVRVSTGGQSLEAQRGAIKRASAAKGAPVEAWFEDVASGSSTDRLALRRLRASARKGQVRLLWIWALDRLNRSGIVDTLSLLREFRDAGVEVCSVADPFQLSGPLAEPCIAMMAWCAQQERERLRERQQEGLRRMRLEGRRNGRPPAIGSDQQAQIRELADAGMSVRRIARLAKCSKSYVWNFLHAATLAE